jgi:hypothetical protein
MKLLFIDHECHKKTRSAEFFLAVGQCRAGDDCLSMG